MSEVLTLPIILGSLNEKIASITGASSPIEGVSLRSINEQDREEFSIPKDIEGVLVSDISGESPFIETLEKGMVILEVNGATTKTIDQIVSSLSEGQNMLYLWFKGTKGFSVIKL